MDAISFFKAAALQLPLRRGPNDHDFEKYLEGIYANYLTEFDNLASSDPLTKLIKSRKSEAEQLCEGVKKAVREYLDGFPHAALDLITAAIDRVRRHVELLVSDINLAGSPFLQTLPHTS